MPKTPRMRGTLSRLWWPTPSQAVIDAESVRVATEGALQDAEDALKQQQDAIDAINSDITAKQADKAADEASLEAIEADLEALADDLSTAEGGCQRLRQRRPAHGLTTRRLWTPRLTRRRHSADADALLIQRTARRARRRQTPRRRECEGRTADCGGRRLPRQSLNAESVIWLRKMARCRTQKTHSSSSRTR